MPYIESKISVPVSEEKREILKREFGKTMSYLNKPEEFLMIGFEDNYDLYMGGKKLEKGAYVSVSLFGAAEKVAYEEVTNAISSAIREQLDIPESAIYITYHEVGDWGWNGKNF